MQSWFSFARFTKMVGLRECRVRLDKEAPEIKTDVESHSTYECKGLMEKV